VTLGGGAKKSGIYEGKSSDMILGTGKKCQPATTPVSIHSLTSQNGK
jgi:hypothetical protein